MDEKEERANAEEGKQTLQAAGLVHGWSSKPEAIVMKKFNYGNEWQTFS